MALGVCSVSLANAISGDAVRFAACVLGWASDGP